MTGGRSTAPVRPPLGGERRPRASGAPESGQRDRATDDLAAAETGWSFLSLRASVDAASGTVDPQRVAYFTDRLRTTPDHLAEVSPAVANTSTGGTRFSPAIRAGPHLPSVVAHEAVHTAQFGRGRGGGPTAPRAALESEAHTGAAALTDGHGFQPRLAAPAGIVLRWEPEGGWPVSEQPIMSQPDVPAGAVWDEEAGFCEPDPWEAEAACFIAELPPAPETPRGPEVGAADRALLLQMEYLPTLKRLRDQRDRARQTRVRYEAAAGSVYQAAAGLSDAIERDEQAAALLQEALELVGLSSVADLVWVEGRYLDMFERKAVEVAEFLLEQSEREARGERTRYRNPEDDPGVLDRLKQAATDISGTQVELINMMNFARRDFNASQGYWGAPTSTVRITPGNFEGYLEGSVMSRSIDVQTSLEKYEVRKAKWAQQFPVLAAPGINYYALAMMPDERLQRYLITRAGHVLEAIEEARDRLEGDNVWDLQPVLGRTEALLGIEPESPASRALLAFRRQRADDKAFWDLFFAAVAIVLVVAATFASGGLTLGALIVEGVAVTGVAAIGTYQAYQSYEEHQFQTAAREAAFDRARAIGNQDPSLGWLALDVALAFVDIAQAVKAFRALVPAARSIVAVRKAVASGEAVDAAVALDTFRVEVRAQATALGKGDDFVERLVATAEDLLGSGSAQARREFAIQSLLMRPDGPGFAALVSGDRRALQNLLAEYGSWERLQRYLDIMRLDEAARGSSALAQQYDLIGQNLVLHRNEIITGLAAKFGAKPLGTASTRRVSDVDVSTYGLAAGKDVIDAERFMAARFGMNWSAALRMNFYTDATRLATYAIDDVMAAGLRGADELPARLRGMTDPEAATLLTEVASTSHVYTSARQLRFAAGNPDLTRRILAEVPEGSRHQVEWLASLDEATEMARRNQLLLEQDDIAKQLYDATRAEKPALIRQLSLNQIELNFHTYEATISPGALRQLAVPGSTLGGWEAVGAAESHFADAMHMLAESGGSDARAARRYELYKYIRRFTQAARWSGEAADPRLARLEEIAEPIARRGGDRTIPETMSEVARVEVFQTFTDYYFDAISRMRSHAAQHPQSWGSTGPLATGSDAALEGLASPRRRGYLPGVRPRLEGEDDE